MTSPSFTTSAPTIGFGDTRPRPPSASSIARARCVWSVWSCGVTWTKEDIPDLALTSRKLVDLHFRAHAVDAERIGVEGEVVGELLAAPRGSARVHELRVAAQRPVVADGVGDRLGLGERAAVLGRAGH